MKRVIDEGHPPTKRVLNVLDCEDWPWAIVELILPWIPRGREVCVRWKECLRHDFQTKMWHAMYHCFTRELGWDEFASGEFERGLRTGVNYGLHLMEDSACSYASIRKVLKSAEHDDSHTLSQMFPFLYGKSTFERTNGVYQAYGIPISDPHHFIAQAARFRLPEKLICDSIVRITKIQCAHNWYQIPFAMACAGISFGSIDSVGCVGSFEIPKGGIEVLLDNLNPAYFEKAEERFPGFVIYAVRHAGTFRKWNIVQWLFAQTLPRDARVQLLQKAMHQMHIQRLTKNDLFDQHIGAALQHISVSTEDVLRVYAKTPVAPIENFLFERTTNDANLEYRMFEIATRTGLPQLEKVIERSSNLKTLFETYFSNIFEQPILEASHAVGMIRGLMPSSCLLLDWKTMCQQLREKAKAPCELALVKRVERLFLKL
jgi:hypothetical protein